MQRKLIDLRAPVVRAISLKAKAKSMSFKKYVETLVEKDAAEGNSYALIPEGVTDPVLTSLVGIAARPCEDDTNDDRLNYIISKMHE